MAFNRTKDKEFELTRIRTYRCLRKWIPDGPSKDNQDRIHSKDQRRNSKKRSISARPIYLPCDRKIRRWTNVKYDCGLEFVFEKNTSLFIYSLWNRTFAMQKSFNKTDFLENYNRESLSALTARQILWKTCVQRPTTNSVWPPCPAVWQNFLTLWCGARRPHAKRYSQW